MPLDILCVGHASFDLCLSVESFPGENSKCETADLVESGGGPAANAACLLATWGARCAFAGLIGQDVNGGRIRDEFRTLGVNTSLLQLRRRHATPLSIIITSKQTASRTIINRKTRAAPFALDAKRVKRLSPKILLFDGHELDAPIVALSSAPRAISVLDAGSWREGTAQLAGRVNYLAASERFALQATGLKNLAGDKSRRACVRQLRERYGNIVIVTLGEHGLMADDGGGFFHLPAFPARAIDTTGAGDIFHGAFAYALLKKMPLRESLRFASMAGSLSVRVAGGRKSIPALHRVKEELARVE